MTIPKMKIIPNTETSLVFQVCNAYKQKMKQEVLSLTAGRGTRKLSLCFNWAARHEGVLGSGDI